jgi:hypothetical protein
MPCAFPSAPSNPRRMCKAHQLSKFAEMGGNLEEVSWTPEKKDRTRTPRRTALNFPKSAERFHCLEVRTWQSLSQSQDRPKATSILLLLPLSITLYATTCGRTHGSSYGAIHPGYRDEPITNMQYSGNTIDCLYSFLGRAAVFFAFS